MKLFSEKVEPTFTNSSFNVLQTENFSEIFFDVYEIELNKIKYPAEKVSSFRGNPVVSVPVVIGEKEQEFPFVLVKGSESIFFNENNIGVPIDDTPLDVEDTDVLFESIDIDHDHRIKEDTKREIMEHIENAKLNARNHAEAIKRDKLKEADTEIRKKNKLLKESLNTAKQQLVKEFISITKSIKRELINEADDKYSELTLTIDNKINDLADTLAESIQSDFENSSKELETNIRAFVKAIHNESVLPELRKSLETIATDAVVRIKGIESDLDKKLTEKVDVSVIEELTSELDALRNSNIELNNTLNKGVNKALSRVGNVNNRLDEAVADITKQVDDKISATADNISSYYSDKLQVLEDQTFELNEKSRQYVVDIVRESRDNLISEIRKIQKEAPVEFVIESAGKKKTKTFDSIQKDIDKKISDRVSDEVIKLRKYIAVYSGGGGTVAQQFADGGVMNGDLIVNGDIFSNGSQVAALVDPVKTTLNGNGILSSFPISGSEGLINPSALTVAIDGALQEPIVDYTVSGGNITFSDPIPLGSKAVIISPVNSLQISQMIPADGSVTSSKLDKSLNLAGNLTVGGNVGIGATTPTAKLDILDTTLAGSGGLSGSALNIAQTWNTNLTPTALSVNVTDLSSNAASLLMDLRVGGVSKMEVSKSGNLRVKSTSADGGPLGHAIGFDNVGITWGFSNGAANQFRFGTLNDAHLYVTTAKQWRFAGTTNIGWAPGTPDGAADLLIARDASNTLAQRNGLNAQESRIYSTYTNASNYERFFIKTNVGATGATQIGLSAAGSGQNRSLEFVAGGSTRMTLTSAGNVGIGINAPTGRLHSYNTTLNNPAGYFQQTRDGGSDYGLRIVSSAVGGAAGVLRVEGSGTGNLVEVFDTETNVFVVKDGGNVGIGTSSPTEKLTVVGNISATGNITTGGGSFVVTSAAGTFIQSGGASNRIITSSERSIIRNLSIGGIDVRNGSDTAGTVACGSLSASGTLTVTGATTLRATTITSAGSFTIGDNATASLNATLSRNGAGALILNATNSAGVNIYGQLQFSNDNVVDIGNVATNRPRNLYVGTGVFAANITASGSLATTPSTRSGPGPLSVTASSIALTTTGVADALTLANGTNGQILTVCHVSRGGGTGTAVLTPATKNGYTTITFTAAGDSVTLQYHTTGGWHVIGSRGVTIA